MKQICSSCYSYTSDLRARLIAMLSFGEHTILGLARKIPEVPPVEIANTVFDLVGIGLISYRVGAEYLDDPDSKVKWRWFRTSLPESLRGRILRD